MKKSKQYVKGSALVFSMLVLTMLLAIAVSGAVITIATKQSARGTEKSILALQTADGAIEEMLYQIYKETRTDLNDIKNNIFGSASASCNNGVISGSLFHGSGSYRVAFYDDPGSAVADRIACDDVGWRAKVIHIVAVGIFAGTTRAMDSGVTPP